MADIKELRRDIDSVDRVLVAYLCRRLEIVREIGAYKAERKLPVLDAAREEEKLKAVRVLAGGDAADYCEAVFREILAASREAQKDIFASEPEN